MNDIHNAIYALGYPEQHPERHQRVTAALVLGNLCHDSAETVAALLGAYMQACRWETVQFDPALIAAAGELLRDFGHAASALNGLKASLHRTAKATEEAGP